PDGAEVHRENRAPTSADAGVAGDVWTVGDYVNGSNHLINGDLSTGSAVGWPEDAKYSETGGPGGGRCVVFDPGKGYSYAFREMGSAPLEEGDTLYLEFWVKADRPNSRLYVTMHDQNGSGTSTANRITDWESVEGGAAGIAPVVSWVVPTQWTKIVSKTTIKPGITEAKIQAFYFNYSAGTERGAGYSIAGLKMYKPKFRAMERYVHDGSSWVKQPSNPAIPFFPVFVYSSVV